MPCATLAAGLSLVSLRRLTPLLLLAREASSSTLAAASLLSFSPGGRASSRALAAVWRKPVKEKCTGVSESESLPQEAHQEVVSRHSPAEGMYNVREMKRVGGGVWGFVRGA